MADETIKMRLNQMIEKHSHDFERVALVLQGGGSLGAYHIGAYKALAEAGYIPDIICGISIGAITSAILAGNEPEDCLAKIEEFWDLVCWPTGMSDSDYKVSDEIRIMQNKYASLMGVLYGQPHFFKPWFPPPQFQQKGTPAATSYYDTSMLKETLLKLCNFDRINQNKTRLITGATKVKTGELVFFDSGEMALTADHVIASGSLPPGFPGVRIDGDLYWDGGAVSNTPVEAIFKVKPHVKTLVFMIDLFNPESKEPETLQEVEWISKNMLYASRTSHHLTHVSENHNLKHSLNYLLKHIPPELMGDPIIEEIKDIASEDQFHFVHIVYHAPKTEINSADCEFSKRSIKERSQHGYEDMEHALSQAHWLEAQADHIGSKVHHYHNKRS